MSKPTREQLDEVFNALVTNGFDFFVRSAQELENEQKFSIAHFATGLELLLKASLFHEHWTLISTEPHKCAWTSVKDGTVRTIQASDLCAAITSTTGTPLRNEQKSFESVFRHRNRVLHWTPNDDLAATVAEQCLAWHYLRALLTGPWKEAFEPFTPRIEGVEQLLRNHRTYLKVIYDQCSARLTGMGQVGRLLTCPICSFRAGVAEDYDVLILPFECLVCGYMASAARVKCGELYALDDLPSEGCQCGDTHDQQELIEVSGASGSGDDSELGYCGDCMEWEKTVILDGMSYACVSCGARFDIHHLTSCERCNEPWFGWDSTLSYYTGCEQCEGQEVED